MLGRWFFLLKLFFVWYLWDFLGPGGNIYIYIRIYTYMCLHIYIFLYTRDDSWLYMYILWISKRLIFRGHFWPSIDLATLDGSPARGVPDGISGVERFQWLMCVSSCNSLHQYLDDMVFLIDYIYRVCVVCRFINIIYIHLDDDFYWLGLHGTYAEWSKCGCSRRQEWHFWQV